MLEPKKETANETSEGDKSLNDIAAKEDGLDDKNHSKEERKKLKYNNISDRKRVELIYAVTVKGENIKLVTSEDIYGSK